MDLLGYKIIGDLTELDNTNNFSFAIAVGDNAVRERIHKELVSATPNLHFPPLVHSSAVISFFTEIGDGAVVKSRSRKSAQDDKWSFCLTAGTLWPANQERP